MIVVSVICERDCGGKERYLPDVGRGYSRLRLGVAMLNDFDG